MPNFAEFPDFGGTIRAYGISPAWMSTADGLLPGGGSWNAAIDRMWVMSGNVPQPEGLSQGLRDYIQAQPRGQVGVSDYVQAKYSPSPGISDYVQAPRGLSGLASTVPAGDNALMNTSTQSHVSTQNQNITLQVPQQGGMLSGDSAPYALAVGGLGLFGLLLWNAIKR